MQSNETKKRILLYGGGWLNNIGNAFIDLGSMVCLRQATKHLDIDIHLHSSSSQAMFYYVNRGITGWLFKRPGDRSKTFDMLNHVKVDYIVQSGAFLSEEWFGLHGGPLLELKKDRGAKLIIHGGGLSESAYSASAIKKTREYLKKLGPYVFISRDEETFENFHDLAEFAYNGIDCGFFVSDSYSPPMLDIPSYIVLNFDKHPQPVDLISDSKEYQVIRTHHSFWSNFPLHHYFKMRANYYKKENTVISELPYEYLTLYAHSKGTYSDRVHACVATLSYGRSARLFSKTPRALLFDRVGVTEITQKLVSADMMILEMEKERQIEFLSSILT
jgi:hypothetical protein